MEWQTVKIQIRLLHQEQSDLGLHCLLFVRNFGIQKFRPGPVTVYYYSLYDLQINNLSLAWMCFQPSQYFVILTSLHKESDMISVQASQYQVLMMSLVVTPMLTGAFNINGVCCWLLLPILSREKTNYIIKLEMCPKDMDPTSWKT